MTDYHQTVHSTDIEILDTLQSNAPTDVKEHAMGLLVSKHQAAITAKAISLFDDFRVSDIVSYTWTIASKNISSADTDVEEWLLQIVEDLFHNDNHQDASESINNRSDSTWSQWESEPTDSRSYAISDDEEEELIPFDEFLPRRPLLQYV